MADIQSLLDQLLQAVYGKDVRQAIHDSIERCYEDGKAGATDLIVREKVDQLQADIQEIQETGATAEVIQTKVQTVINGLIADGTMAALSIGDGTVTSEKLADDVFNSLQVKTVFDEQSGLMMINSSSLSLTGEAIGWDGVDTYPGYTWSSATERAVKDKYTCTDWFSLPEGIYKIPKVWTSDPYGNISAIIHAKMRDNGLYVVQLSGDLFFAQSECLYAVTLPTETFNDYVINSNYNFDAMPIVIDISELIEKQLINQSGTRWRIDITESVPQDEIKNLAYMYFVGFPDYEFASDESWNNRVYPSGISDGGSIAYSHICLYKSGSSTVIDINGPTDEKWFLDRGSKIILGKVT